ncbi:ATP-binding protein [Aliiroseovarius zhejiangensis]|uniref:ATP-binding protein n=1 Tax=Aliiroseovarius zhejiangensis TaxID=1632025 RepID=A0ABQ3J9W4_9RHOB|nr:AAA family ATPase [Aliiroseovarius zhejiangensis]GHF09260.1 ATP-binding protein [Aliiroseovarius zhejiangensis]
MTGQRNGTFIATKEHRRFVEFATAVQKHRYIGICFGTAGVGKTMSARRFARWDKAEPLLTEWGPRDASDAIAYEALAKSRTVFYTPTVGGPVREVREDLRRLIARAEGSIDLALNPSMVIPERHTQGSIEVLVVDEAERLSTQSLEHVRDIFDRTGIGVILIGMPGLERKLERYPQLYSRIGFAHHYRPLKGDELTFVLTRHWRKLGLQLDAADFTDHQAIASIARITGGNFRLLHRLFVQIERILKINELSLVTDDVVEAARSTLVIGAT